MTIDWRPFAELVNASQSFVLTSHMRPDCDAIGSELALALALRSLGKEVRIVNADPVPPHIAFIDPQRDARVLGRDVSAKELKSDVLLVVDTSAWVQLGPMADVVRQTTARKAVIDHHVSEDDMSAAVFKDATADATGRLVLEAIGALGVEVTPAIAAPLFTAIATDTGWFRFSSVSEATFLAAARLVAAGASPPAVFAALYEQNSLGRLRLQGRILTNIQSDLAGRLLYAVVTQADLRETGAEPTDTEDVINRLLTVAGVEVALLFLELGPGETKVSLRSHSACDVRAIAEQFGGGGHRAAAGVRYPGPVPKAVADVVGAARTALTKPC
ncbi:MAG: DHH family phosphoesterase [Planctomycetes bacterium]|nr:DHH family phosphoesterase [Planctomycetota bacterium]